MSLPVDQWRHAYCEKITEFVYRNLDFFEYVLFVQKVRRNQLIYLMDDPADRFFIVREGAVRLSRITDDGREEILRIIGPGEYFGTVCLCAEHTWDHQAAVHEDGIIASMKSENFIRVFFRHDQLLQRFMAFFSDKMDELDRAVQAYRHDLAQVKLGHFLRKHLENVRVSGDTVRLTIPNWMETVGKVTGLPFLEVERILLEWKERGILDWKRNTVHLHISALDQHMDALLTPDEERAPATKSRETVST